MDINVIIIGLLAIALIATIIALVTLRQRTQALRQQQEQLSTELRAKQAAYQQLTLAEAQLKNALNTLPIPVLMADEHEKLFFSNRVANELLQAHQAEMTQLLGAPLLAQPGESIKGFNKISDKQVRINHTDFKVDRTIGHQVNTVILQNITNKTDMSNTIIQALEALRDGDLNAARIDTKGLTEQHLELANKINQALEPIDQLIRQTNHYLSMQANAKLDEAPKPVLKGALGQLQFAQNLSLSNTASFVTEVDTKANRIISSMQELNGNVHNVSDRVQSQAAAIAQIASATQHISDRSTLLDEQMQRMTKDADTTGHQLTDAEEAINKASAAMNDIQEKSRKIEEIVGLIDGIAFQTNLLALNAAVEAARAGEHGRGFAVVAGEVRALAGKSAEAAKNIKELINETISDIRLGGQVFSHASAAINQMNHSVAGLTSAIGGMRIGVGDTAKGVNEINKGIDLLDDSLQQIAALVEETAAASEETIDTATRLGTSVSRFSTGLMTQLLAAARRQDDFRFANGRRAVRLWGMHVAAYLLGMENNTYINQDPLATWRSTASDANLSQINQAMTQLMQLAQHLHQQQRNEPVSQHMPQFYAAVNAVTDAITAEESRILAGGAAPRTAALPHNPTAPTSVKSKQTALPAPNAAANTQEWEDF